MTKTTAKNIFFKKQLANIKKLEIRKKEAQQKRKRRENKIFRIKQNKQTYDSRKLRLKNPEIRKEENMKNLERKKKRQENPEIWKLELQKDAERKRKARMSLKSRENILKKDAERKRRKKEEELAKMREDLENHVVISNKIKTKKFGRNKRSLSNKVNKIRNDRVILNTRKIERGGRNEDAIFHSEQSESGGRNEELVANVIDFENEHRNHHLVRSTKSPETDSISSQTINKQPSQTKKRKNTRNDKSRKTNASKRQPKIRKHNSIKKSLSWHKNSKMKDFETPPKKIEKFEAELKEMFYEENDHQNNMKNEDPIIPQFNFFDEENQQTTKDNDYYSNQIRKQQKNNFKDNDELIKSENFDKVDSNLVIGQLDSVDAKAQQITTPIIDKVDSNLVTEQLNSVDVKDQEIATAIIDKVDSNSKIQTSIKPDFDAQKNIKFADLKPSAKFISNDNLFEGNHRLSECLKETSQLLNYLINALIDNEINIGAKITQFQAELLIEKSHILDKLFHLQILNLLNPIREKFIGVVLGQKSRQETLKKSNKTAISTFNQINGILENESNVKMSNLKHDEHNFDCNTVTIANETNIKMSNLKHDEQYVIKTNDIITNELNNKISNLKHDDHSNYTPQLVSLQTEHHADGLTLKPNNDPNFAQQIFDHLKQISDQLSILKNNNPIADIPIIVKQDNLDDQFQPLKNKKKTTFDNKSHDLAKARKRAFQKHVDSEKIISFFIEPKLTSDEQVRIFLEKVQKSKKVINAQVSHLGKFTLTIIGQSSAFTRKDGMLIRRLPKGHKLENIENQVLKTEDRKNAKLKLNNNETSSFCDQFAHFGKFDDILSRDRNPISANNFSDCNSFDDFLNK